MKNNFNNFIKKFAGIIFSIILLVTSTNTTYALEFSDIDNSNVFYMYIQNLVEREIINGYPDKTFRPDNYVTRGELSKFIVNAFGLQSELKINNFRDIDESNVFYQYIITLNNLAIVSGYTDKTFKPQNIVTRGEVMKFIVNASKIKNTNLFSKTTKITIFGDVDNTNIFFEYVNPAASIELTDGTRIINGYSDKSFGVHNAINRGEITKLISQTISYAENGGKFNPPSSEIEFEDNNVVDTPDRMSSFDLFGVYEINSSSINLIDEEKEFDKEKAREVWNEFVYLVPSGWRTRISHYVIFSDGKDNSLAAVYRNVNDLDSFVLSVDLGDLYDEDGKLDTALAEYAFIHELAHVITLNTDEIEVTTSLYDAETSEEIVRLQEIASGLCENYYVFDGCSEENSKINTFVSIYWEYEQLGELKVINEIADKTKREEAQYAFYEKFKDDFVSVYSSTNPDEDIAESFAYFIMQDEPQSGEKVKDQKILFFYDFDELVDLRDLMREKL